jgi:G3E family GTPase
LHELEIAVLINVFGAINIDAQLIFNLDRQTSHDVIFSQECESNQVRKVAP